MALTNSTNAPISSALQQESDLPQSLTAGNISAVPHNRDSPADESTAAHRTAALRQLNGAPLRSRQHDPSIKPTSSRTSLSSQPVIVRTYSGSRSRPHSQVRSPAPVPRDVMNADARLPPIEAFTFDNILRAVEPEIRGAIDAIAEICARSKMSLADEYTAHMPPQGEITEGQRIRQLGHAHRGATVEHPLTVVPEASSGSERSAGGSRASTSSRKGKTTAVGSLKNIMSGSFMSGSGRGKAVKERGRKSLTDRELPQETGSNEEDEGKFAQRSNIGPGSHHARANSSRWIMTRNSQPSITVVSIPTTSKVACARASTDMPMVRTGTDADQGTHLTPLASVPQSQHRLGSVTLWLPWRSSQTGNPPQKGTSGASLAESKLKDILTGVQLSARMPHQDTG